MHKFHPTRLELPHDVTVTSHRLLMSAGFIRSTDSGLYSLLPLGHRVMSNIRSIVNKHLDDIGGQQLSLPILSKSTLWEKTGRWDLMGDELFRLNDRRNANFCLAPTHEETITDLVASVISSPKDFPLRLYQIEKKFRDEIRPRHGLVRAREFEMMDMYTFDIDMEKSLETYSIVKDAYFKIFNDLEIPVSCSKADSGNIGGSLSHEFHVLNVQSGEDTIIYCDSCKSSANLETAQFCWPNTFELVHNVKGNINSEAKFIPTDPDNFVRSLPRLLLHMEIFSDAFPCIPLLNSPDPLLEILYLTTMLKFAFRKLNDTERPYTSDTLEALSKILSKFDNSSAPLDSQGSTPTSILDIARSKQIPDNPDDIFDDSNTIVLQEITSKSQLNDFDQLDSFLEFDYFIESPQNTDSEPTMESGSEASSRLIIVMLPSQRSVNYVKLSKLFDHPIEKVDLDQLTKTKGKVNPTEIVWVSAFADSQLVSTDADNSQISRVSESWGDLIFKMISLAPSNAIPTSSHSLMIGDIVNAERGDICICNTRDMRSSSSKSPIPFEPSMSPGSSGSSGSPVLTVPTPTNIPILKSTRGLEVGHIFHLGTKYSKPLGASINTNTGKAPLDMGCYGIGISRTMAAIVDVWNDNEGISWPFQVAPYQIAILPLFHQNEHDIKVSQETASILKNLGYSVFVDDRSISPGHKLKDAGLIGYPVTLIIGKNFAETGKFEVKFKHSVHKLFSLDGIEKQDLDLETLLATMRNSSSNSHSN